mmetsp:Transcript_3884/g.8600  ORF Transcript_3884/g.8600 Transcript_3884/m.8600 type:complete len:135 (+) Transcript_3884:455-859(+)
MFGHVCAKNSMDHQSTELTLLCNCHILSKVYRWISSNVHKYNLDVMILLDAPIVVGQGSICNIVQAAKCQDEIIQRLKCLSTQLHGHATYTSKTLWTGTIILGGKCYTEQAWVLKADITSGGQLVERVGTAIVL